MSEATTRLRVAVVDCALHGPGFSSAQLRRAAFDNGGVDGRAEALVDTVARNAWKVTDEQVADTLAAGVSEDVVFELAVSAALGQATRQLSAALAALDEATAEYAGHDERGESHDETWRARSRAFAEDQGPVCAHPRGLRPPRARRRQDAAVPARLFRRPDEPVFQEAMRGPRRGRSATAN